jgi:ferredoxin-NADP reductase
VRDTLDVSSPRGSFILQSGAGPVVLLSAGIGVTPVLSMLYELSESHSARPVLWLQAARDGAHHPFAAEVRRLMLALTHGRSYVAYSRPDSRDKAGEGFDAVGHLSQMVFDEVGLPREADVYLCGPNRFMADMKEVLLTHGQVPPRIHAEIFNGSESMTPGVVSAAPRAPHLPTGDTNTGPLVSFARSGIAAHWRDSAYQSILELAEACDVPVRWSCRTGVCHNCESGLVSGAVDYRPAPLEKPADGNVLVCCSQPSGDIVVDL